MDFKSNQHDRSEKSASYPLEIGIKTTVMIMILLDWQMFLRKYNVIYGHITFKSHGIIHFEIPVLQHFFLLLFSCFNFFSSHQ